MLQSARELCTHCRARECRIQVRSVHACTSVQTLAKLHILCIGMWCHAAKVLTRIEGGRLRSTLLRQRPHRSEHLLECLDEWETPAISLCNPLLFKLLFIFLVYDVERGKTLTASNRDRMPMIKMLVKPSLMRRQHTSSESSSSVNSSPLGRPRPLGTAMRSSSKSIVAGRKEGGCVCEIG